MKMSKVYHVIMKFRSGHEMTLKGKSAVLAKGKVTPYNVLYIDGVEMAILEKGSPNFDQSNNITVYNARPLPILFEKMPEDWDKTIPSLKIIDELKIITVQQAS